MFEPDAIPSNGAPALSNPTPTDRIKINSPVFGRLQLSELWLIVFMALVLSPFAAWAQQRETTDPNSGITTDITLTKNVEVYSYEDLTFSIDTYSVRPGDNLAAILKSQGLWPQSPDQTREAQLLKLVGELNPVVANLDLIAPGQILYLPSSRGLEESRLTAKSDSNSQAVVSYELGQPAQSPARVVIKHQPPVEEELGPGEYRLSGLGVDLSGTKPFQRPTGTPALNSSPPAEQTLEPAPAAPPAASSRARSSASGNEGALGTAADGTVYRTVTVRKGDTLEKLLRREGLDRNLIYRGLIGLTVELNPGLKNPNMIVVGAELRIPVDTSRIAGPATSLASASPTPAAASAASQSSQTIAPSAGDKYSTPTKRLPAAPIPTADTLNAKTAFGIIFTRLGENFLNQGRLFLPLDEPPHFDIDTAKISVLELNNGRKVVLDLNSSFSTDFISRFVAKYHEYVVFQPSKKEPFAKAFERLLAMCGYYRIYDKNQPFEGGRDVRLKIAADWLIWPNADSWNRGQPVVINLAPAADNGTPQVWQNFLGDHGIRVIDLYQGQLLSGSGKLPTPVNNFAVIELEDNPSAFAASLVRSLGYSPRFGVKVEATRGRVVTGGIDVLTGTPPVFWETENSRNILEYGDLSNDDLDILRKNGFNIISSGKDLQAILKAIMGTLNIKLDQNLVLNGDSSGGPAITLTIAGQSFKFNGRSYLFTPVTLPDNMTSLDPNQNVIVLHYRPRPATEISSSGPAPGSQPNQTQAAPSDQISGQPGGAISVEDIN
ncbi:MAG: LysM peptidoglycan-binding domain-containing protein [Deltaproteobacteria bacterium]|nr:LysM peptidoglycan-binding domain-containing protein [Deltaproteobacteria bacterium]